MSEAVATFIFISVILSVKYHNGGTDILNALAVGGTLFGMISMIAKISGAAINPAVGIVQTIAQNIVYGDARVPILMSYETMWIYILGPFTGGVLAALWSKFNETMTEA